MLGVGRGGARLLLIIAMLLDLDKKIQLLFLLSSIFLPATIS
jgi:hypothetical protein